MNERSRESEYTVHFSYNANVTPHEYIHEQVFDSSFLSSSSSWSSPSHGTLSPSSQPSSIGEKERRRSILALRLNTMKWAELSRFFHLGLNFSPLFFPRINLVYVLIDIIFHDPLLWYYGTKIYFTSFTLWKRLASLRFVFSFSSLQSNLSLKTKSSVFQTSNVIES